MKQQLLDKFIGAEERLAALEALLAAPDAMRDMALYRARLTEWKGISPMVEAYHAYQNLLREITDTEQLIRVTAEPDLSILAAEELAALKCELTKQETALTAFLLPHDPRDERNVIMEIRAGAGGEEAALFAADLYRMYTMYAQRAGYSCELISANETGLGGFREIDFTVNGRGAYSRLKFESGVHRVQRIPQTESNGKIQTSTVTVAVLTEVDEVDVTLRPQDIKMESCKSSGAGGQHINKTESAVRLTHIPSGLVVECQEQRSQLKNREKAMKLLEAKLYAIEQREHDGKIAADRRSQVGTGERCERIRTYNFPQGRVTDHRIGMTVYNIDRFLAGEMEELLTALAADETEKAIKGSFGNEH